MIIWQILVFKSILNIILTFNFSITWANFKTKFITKFSLPKAYIASSKQISKLKQTSGLTTYIEQFLLLTNQTWDISVDSQILMFCRKLNTILSSRSWIPSTSNYIQSAIDMARLDIAFQP